VPEVTPPPIPEDLNIAIKSGKVRAPTHIISTISDDRGLINGSLYLTPRCRLHPGGNFSRFIHILLLFTGEEPCYAGVPMSTIIERGYGVGDVISLLWFKRSLPRYCTQFIEVGKLSSW